MVPVAAERRKEGSPAPTPRGSPVLQERLGVFLANPGCSCAALASIPRFLIGMAGLFGLVL